MTELEDAIRRALFAQQDDVGTGHDLLNHVGTFEPAPSRRRGVLLMCVVAAVVVTLVAGTTLVAHQIGRGSGGAPVLVAPSPSATTPSCTATAVRPSARPQPAAVTVTVVNGTTRPGLAAHVATELRTDGFVVLAIESGLVTAGVGQIQFSPGQQAAAALLSYYLPGVSAPTPSTSTLHTGVALLLGPAFEELASPSAVQRAIQRDTTSTCP